MQLAYLIPHHTLKAVLFMSLILGSLMCSLREHGLVASVVKEDRDADAGKAVAVGTNGVGEF